LVTPEGAVWKILVLRATRVLGTKRIQPTDMVSKLILVGATSSVATRVFRLKNQFLEWKFGN
jgi:hypothetical protein